MVRAVVNSVWNQVEPSRNSSPDDDCLNKILQSRECEKALAMLLKETGPKWNGEDICQCLRKWHTHSEWTQERLTLWALGLLVLHTGWRPSDEVSTLLCQNVCIRPEDGALLLGTPYTKTRMTLDVALHPIDERAICPVFAMMEYLKWHDTVRPRVDTEQIFLSTTQYKVVTRQLRAKWFKDLLKYCSIHDTAHTFCAVAALDMLNSGMSLVDVKI
ncbi:hypothetical protein FBU31_002722 [Coemansia sp. 'formosensis']|nr:hypothetical protein FBU31_002722 [Coemansia sp. 'formosensis']